MEGAVPLSTLIETTGDSEDKDQEKLNLFIISHDKLLHLFLLFPTSLCIKLFSRVVELYVQGEQSCTLQVSLAADLTVKAGLGSRTSDYYSICF